MTHTVRYIGDGDNDPPHVTLYGVTFPLNQDVHVTPDNERSVALIKKLQHNRHFMVDGEGSKVTPVKEEMPLVLRKVERRRRGVEADANANS